MPPPSWSDLNLDSRSVYARPRIPSSVSVVESLAAFHHFFKMSSFKRKVVSKQTVIPTGAKYLPGSSSVFITSTGIPSLDDILGGGLPLTCSQLILAPDTHSEYGELVQKYFISQGLASGQQLCVVHDQPREFVEGCMWTPAFAASSMTVADDEEDKPQGQDSKIKIAWRYEQMKQFQTTVPSDQYVLSPSS